MTSREAEPRAVELVVLRGSAHPDLAAALADELGAKLGSYETLRFPDGEIRTEVGADVQACHAVLVQPTNRPGGEHLLELLFMADACRRAGARAISAIIPYLGYARQDKRTRQGQALGMRVVGDVLGCARFEHVVVIDLHADQVEGFLDVPVEHLSAVPLLAEAVRRHAGRDAVVVSPDLGAARLARAYAEILGLPTAILHKTRTSGVDVVVERVIGDVRGRRPILVDDMITTGGTLAAAAGALAAEGCTPDVTAVATHAVLVPPAVDRLKGMGLGRLIVSNSLPPPRDLPFPCEIVDVAPLLAEGVLRVVRSAR
jgi:ribose-phosphate pyrophosphokinase